MEKLNNILESIIFASGEQISKADICASLQIDKKELKKAIESLKQKYSGDSGIILMEFGEKVQFVTNKDFSNEIATVLNPIREKALSKAAMESLSIVAYKQPVTRLDIEEIRGVNSDYTINLLLENNLIQIVGRKEALGKPLLFGTTDEFLRRFDLESIDNLPSYESLLDRLQTVSTVEEKQDDRLFNFKDIEKQKEEEAKINKELKNNEIIDGDNDCEDFI